MLHAGGDGVRDLAAQALLEEPGAGHVVCVGVGLDGGEQAEPELFEDLGVPPLNPEEDRVMICGSMDMLKDTKELCEKAGLVEGSNATPATYVVERAFVG